MDDQIRNSFVARYQRDGFVHIPGVLSPTEMAVFAPAVDEAVGRRKANDTRALADKSAYEQSFIQCQYLWEDSPTVRPLTFHPNVGAWAAALLGAPKVRLWHDQALFKEAGGRETEAHQDHPYWPIAELETLTVWIPLQDVDETTGCMGYVPGSQESEAEFIDIFNSPGAGKALEAKFAATPPVWVPARAGDLIFHHGLTVHMAKANRSERTRRAYTAIYFADGCTRAGDRAHPSVDRDRIAVGQVIDGAATPIAWPLRDGHLPTPRPWPQVLDPRRTRAANIGIIPSDVA